MLRSSLADIRRLRQRTPRSLKPRRDQSTSRPIACCLTKSRVSARQQGCSIRVLMPLHEKIRFVTTLSLDLGSPYSTFSLTSTSSLTRCLDISVQLVAWILQPKPVNSFAHAVKMAATEPNYLSWLRESTTRILHCAGVCAI